MIRLRDVQKRYSRGEQSVLACAVDSLEIAAGEQVALIGSHVRKDEEELDALIGDAGGGVAQVGTD